ncbi:MAG TPA: TonB family protein [Vicinamibacterales bacterium]|nr:TonB family protein [Vicinamibacterales bacterium]
MTEKPLPDANTHAVVSAGWLGADSTFTRTESPSRKRAFLASLMLHGVGLFVVLAMMAWVPKSALLQVMPPEKVDLVFVQAAGPGGGGGGGNKMPDPPRKLEMKAELPKPPVIEPVKTDIPPPTLLAPVQTNMAMLQSPGAVIGLSAAPSLGTGGGTGAGPGKGPGIGPGTGGGFGDGAMREGSGAQPPTLLRRVDPKYTTEAMRAKVQGDVTVEAVVGPDGTVKDVRIAKSLDRGTGLDEEALKTAREWRFRPATYQGQPVPFLVLIVMTFNLR